MKIILLDNMIIKGRRYRAGEAVEMDAEHADALQFMDLAYIDPAEDVKSKNTGLDASVEAESDEVQADTQTVEKKASKRPRKAAKK